MAGSIVWIARRRSRATRRVATLALALALIGGGAQCLRGPAAAARGRAAVVLLEIEGIINPSTERYLTRGLADAANDGVALVVIRLDTPGGTMKSMRAMTRELLSASVPVAVYVAPAGAQAASAGMFIAGAAHVAAMAPGANIGAAHPVALGRAGEGDKIMAEKVVNDAAALARAVANQRGRNAEWYERAVRESVSITASEALELGVVDVVAADLRALLVALDGRKLTTAQGIEHTLRTADARVETRPMGLVDRILHVITDPNIAYLLFTLGLIGLAAELYNPGMIFPGVVGVVALVLALTAFGTLPINWAGIVLLLVGLGLLVGELATEGIGFLGVGGAIAFVLGSLMLYRPAEVDPAMPSLQLSPWLIGAVVIVVLALLFIVGRALLRSRGLQPYTGAEALVGRVGVVVSPLAPNGTVRVDSETWSAIAEGGDIGPGQHVRVLGLEGVVLRVVRDEP